MRSTVIALSVMQTSGLIGQPPLPTCFRRITAGLGSLKCDIDMATSVKTIVGSALFAFPFAMVLLASFAAVTTVIELENGTLSGVLFALFTAVMFAFSSPIFLPLFVVVVPSVALIPAIALLASLATVRVVGQPNKILFAIWLIAWIAIFAVAISSGKIST